MAHPLAKGRINRRYDLGTILLYSVLAVVAVAFLMPFLLMLSAAFKTADEIMKIPPDLLPQHPTLRNFTYVLSHAPFFTWYRNSLLVSTSVTALVLFTSSMAGYIFAKFDFPGKSALFLLILVTLMIPFPVIFIPSYLVVSYLGLLNNLLALIIPAAVSAFGVFMMRQHIAGIPNDLIEAARMDGASEFAIFRMVILPLSTPMLAPLGIFTFLSAWNDYLWPLTVINDVDKQTLPLALVYFNSTHAQRYDLVMASAVLTIIPIVLIFLIFQRWIIGAFMLSGLKG
jgi:multiple sugar transport system permease protein